MTENRFFQTFFAVLASAVLVGGSLILLTSTAPWAPPRLEIEASTPDAAQIAAEPSIDAHPRATIDSDQTRTLLPEDPEAAPAPTAAAPAVLEPVEPRKALSPQAVAPEAQPAEESESVAALGTPLDPETDDANVADVHPATSEAKAPDAPPVVASEVASPEDVTAALPEPQPQSSLAEEKAAAATDALSELLVDLPPRAIPSDKAEQAAQNVAAVLADTPPVPDVAAMLADTPPVPAAKEAEPVAKEQDAAPELVAASPPPPLPRRKPEVVPVAEAQAEAPAPSPETPAKPEAPKVAEEAVQPRNKGPWQPMALAPADKPALKAPTARPSGAGYANSVWAALARNKPRAGQSGSATVMFAIGPNGALRALRVGRSSGNARIDQLALATVRRAAPFPPPPSGSASYSIRIDFH